MKSPRYIGLVGMPGTHALEIVGPYEVFSRAAEMSRSQRLNSTYKVEVIGLEARPIGPDGALCVLPQRLYRTTPKSIDTLLVVGGASAPHSTPPQRFLTWLSTQVRRARRWGSVCAGTFVLAEAGLLNGRRVTTHWGLGSALARRYPKVDVDSSQIFSRDHNLYTSAGVTAGMDLALALVEEDFGHRFALDIARDLVLFLRRSGNQRQFSSQLELQATDFDSLRELLSWIAEHVDHELTVEELAAKAGMSPRNFARVFVRELGITPAKHVEQVRLDAARRRLEESAQTVERIATEVGLGSVESLRRAFLKHLNTTPGAYRQHFQRSNK
ncbi:MAG: DJ-1/PfpI family protein [Acidobacteriia bacterium]|nr:DJ-1/PfpI family protein [Terriglobia bacterium]